MYRLLSPFHLFAPVSPPAGLVFVGGVANLGINNAVSYEQSLSGTLSGGIATSPAAGDFILVGSSIALVELEVDMTCVGNVTGAYAEIADLYANDESMDFSFGAHWAIAGATPDATLTLKGTQGAGTANGAVCCIQVWRNVNPTTPLDGVDPVTATGINSANTTPGAITPATAGARVIVIGGSTAPPTSTVEHATSTGYEYKTYALCNNTDTRKPRMGIISKAWSGSGAETPAQWTASDTSTVHSWAAVTLVLRPAA